MAQFLEFMRKMIEGKPVFEKDNPKSNADEPVPQNEQPASPASKETQGSTIVKHHEDTFPVIEVRRVKTHNDGNNIQIYCQFENTWHEEILLDKIRLLNTKLELDFYLRPGEVRDFLVYKGPKLRAEDKHAEIDYCTSRDKDYFRAEFAVRYSYDQVDNSYTIDDMRLDEPIRDIYE